MALDVGEKRIGVALSDPEGILASPHRIIESAGIEADVTQILAIAFERDAGEIVVGLPVSLDGQEHGQAAKIREFAAAITARSPLPLVFQDERYSTVTATNLRRESGKRRGRQRRYLDDAAAAVILQEYLDQIRDAGQTGSED
jgi:putative Holliday junction resolvase